MPIKYLHERRRYMRLGKIRLGVQVEVMTDAGKPKMKDGQPVMRPKATDYFVVKEEVEGAGADILANYGEEPNELDIRFLFEDDHQTFPQWLKMYRGDGILRCMGDGEIVLHRRYTDFTDKKNEIDEVLVSNGNLRWGEQDESKILEAWAEQYGTDEVLVGSAPYVSPGQVYGKAPMGDAIRCLGESCPQYGPRGCRPTGRLLFMVEGVDRLGFWEMVVHQHAIIGINSQLELCRAFTAQYLGRPTILHVPFKLRLRGPETMKIGDYKAKVWTPEIEPDPDWIADVVASRFQLPEVPKITSGGIWGPEEPKELPSSGTSVTVVAPEEEEPLEYDPTEQPFPQELYEALWAYAKEKKLGEGVVIETLGKCDDDPEKALIVLKEFE